MPTPIQQKRDTAVNWIIQNPILKDGEMGYDTTNVLFKIGNGVDTWQNLKEFNPNCLFIAGNWDCSTATYPTSYDTGWIYICSVPGTISSTPYKVNDWLIYDGSSWRKIDNNQSGNQNLTTVTSNYTTTSSDRVIIATPTTSSFVITLDYGISGFVLTIKKPGFNGNNVTINSTTGNIDGITNYILNCDDEFVQLQHDGANWWVIAE